MLVEGPHCLAQEANLFAQHGSDSNATVDQQGMTEEISRKATEDGRDKGTKEDPGREAALQQRLDAQEQQYTASIQKLEAALDELRNNGSTTGDGLQQVCRYDHAEAYNHHHGR